MHPQDYPRGTGHDPLFFPLSSSTPICKKGGLPAKRTIQDCPLNKKKKKKKKKKKINEINEIMIKEDNKHTHVYPPVNSIRPVNFHWNRRPHYTCTAGNPLFFRGSWGWVGIIIFANWMCWREKGAILHVKRSLPLILIGKSFGHERAHYFSIDAAAYYSFPLNSLFLGVRMAVFVTPSLPGCCCCRKWTLQGHDGKRIQQHLRLTWCSREFRLDCRRAAMSPGEDRLWIKKRGKSQVWYGVWYGDSIDLHHYSTLCG